MLRMRSDYGPHIRWKDQILSKKLHHENGEVLAMLRYGEGYTDKSIVYLVDDDVGLVGYVYIEHYRSQGKPHKGTFGIFLQPEYRRQGHGYRITEALKEVVTENGWFGVIVEIDPKALKIFQHAFGREHPIQLLS